jgi:hypothetical protein
MEVSIIGACLPVTPESLAHDYEQLTRASGMLKNRLDIVTETMVSMITSGKPVPGYTLERGVSALKWSIPDPVAAAADIGVDISKPREPITPTQAIARKLLPKEMVEIMARREPTSPKLTHVNVDKIKDLING